MHKSRCIGLFLFILHLNFFLTALCNAQEERPGVKLIAKATSRSIKLRWAPSTPTLWKLGNKYGYTIERAGVTENGKMIDRRIMQVGKTIPATQGEWERELDKDDFVAIAAQAIFGETFDVSAENSSDVAKIINQSRELEARYSYAVFAADHSLPAAKLSGLYHEDETIAPGTKYLYRVYANIPPSIMSADTGVFFIGLEDYRALPRIFNLRAEFDDRQVMLSWDGRKVEKIYNSFVVERSLDGQVFKNLSNAPIINTYSGNEPKSSNIFKSDSLPSNDVRYFYRVRGIDAFGDAGPASDTVSGKGRSKFAYSAAIKRHSISNNGTVMLEWEFPDGGLSLLQEFELIRMDIKTKLTTVIEKGIWKGSRQAVDSFPLSSNYYVVRAADRYNRKNNSFPYLVQLEDSIPPAMPTGLQGRIDSTGLVFLEWKPNSESDLKGYELYRANYVDEEFIRVPGSLITSTSYVDTISLASLTETIYYQVVAVDKRFNASVCSQYVELKKPDIHAPVPPVFKMIKSDSVGIILQWFPSTSSDVVSHVLYRKLSTELGWSLMAEFAVGDTMRCFVDTNVHDGRQYDYTIVAVDDAGNESDPAQPATSAYRAVTKSSDSFKLFYKKIHSEVDLVELSWTYDSAVQSYIVYKANNADYATHRVLDGSSTSTTDILSKKIVKFLVAAVLPSGRKVYSRPITIIP